MDFINAIIAAPFLCIGWLIVGAIAGAIANRIMGGPDRSIVVDIVVGLIGAFIGGIILSILGLYQPEGGIGGIIANFVVAIIGAVVLLAILRAVSGRR